MKSVRSNRLDVPIKPKYLKGHLYINTNKVIIICDEDNDCTLNGIIIDSPDFETVGNYGRINISSCPYEEFHGTVILDN